MLSGKPAVTGVEAVICYVMLCRGQLSDEKNWLLQMKSLDLFNPVTPGTTLCKFCQSFIDTVAYIFSCTGENQQSMENSEHSGSESEGAFFSSLVVCFGVWVWGDYFVVVVVPQGQKICLS